MQAINCKARHGTKSAATHGLMQAINCKALQRNRASYSDTSHQGRERIRSMLCTLAKHAHELVAICLAVLLLDLSDFEQH